MGRPEADPYKPAERGRRNAGATLDDLREAVETLAETEPIARRVLGSAHPDTEGIEDNLRHARAALAARETPPLSEPRRRDLRARPRAR